MKKKMRIYSFICLQSTRLHITFMQEQNVLHNSRTPTHIIRTKATELHKIDLKYIQLHSVHFMLEFTGVFH